ncbi:MAG: squalene--hopene cyclase [Bacillota bacterium]
MERKVVHGMEVIIETLKQYQSPNGSWNYPFETGISTDCYMIILLRSLEINEENLIKALTKRILSKQEDNGAWKLFYDEGEGNLSATVEAYYALLYSGYYRKNDLRLRNAKKFILKNGGLENAHMFTKIMLAVTGQQKWPKFFPIPVEMILLPQSFPINFYSFSEYGRTNLTPIMILADKKFSLKTLKSPDLSDLNNQRDDFFTDRELDEWRSLHSTFKKLIKKLIGFPSELHRLATEQAKQYMLHRVEPDGTFYGYFSSTFLMIFALLSLGYSKNNPKITNAVAGLISMQTEINGFPHMQYTTATVWNTSLISYALQEARVSQSNPMVKKANDYLISRQHYKYGDWAVHNPNAFPGGWGFADKNTIHPDVDDTTASLRAISREAQMSSEYLHSWQRGTQWVLSMQNDDGGWPAFEKNTDSKLLKLLPIEKAEYILTDPSSADLTGRTLEYLGLMTNLNKNHHAIKAAIRWLKANQEQNGSWYGRWGICYIYGTWAAVTGLMAVGVLPSQTSITKAVNWLKTIQNPDGGWGESCKSDEKGEYVPLNSSTLTHTAWAVDTLISVAEKPSYTINKGIQFILNHLERDDWTTDYPKGQGMAGDFYIHYHSYRYIFPLLALAHYRNKFIGK